VSYVTVSVVWEGGRGECVTHIAARTLRLYSIHVYIYVCIYIQIGCAKLQVKILRTYVLHARFQVGILGRYPVYARRPTLTPQYGVRRHHTRYTHMYVMLLLLVSASSFHDPAKTLPRHYQDKGRHTPKHCQERLGA
jgi:hypothetical protein